MYLSRRSILFSLGRNLAYNELKVVCALKEKQTRRSYLLIVEVSVC